MKKSINWEQPKFKILEKWIIKSDLVIVYIQPHSPRAGALPNECYRGNFSL